LLALGTGVGSVCRSVLSCLLGFFFLLFLQGFDDAVYGRQALAFRHLGQFLQAVLKFHGIQVGGGLVECLRAPFRFGVFLMLFVQDGNALGVCALGIDVFFCLPVDLRQTKQHHSLGGSALGAFLSPLLVGADAFERVAARKVDVANGVVHLVEIVLVLVALGHALEFFNHGLGRVARHHLGLQDAGIEGQFVGRIAAHDAGKRLVGIVVQSQFVLHLPHEEVQSRALQLVFGVLNGLAQFGDGLFVLFGGYQVGGPGGGQFALSFGGDAVAPHLVEHILCVVGPLQCHVATGQPCAGYTADFGLGGIEADDVVEGGGGLDELALLELCLAQHHPGVAQIGVELPAGTELFRLRCQFLAIAHRRTFLDAV